MPKLKSTFRSLVCLNVPVTNSNNPVFACNMLNAVKEEDRFAAETYIRNALKDTCFRLPLKGFCNAIPRFKDVSKAASHLSLEDFRLSVLSSERRPLSNPCTELEWYRSTISVFNGIHKSRILEEYISRFRRTLGPGS